MPPKCKFTRQQVVTAAFEIAKENGIYAVTARALGERLGSSPRPIFTLFKSMQEMQDEVLSEAYGLYMRYTADEMAQQKYPAYKASGMAYIRFAREQRELFKLLFMRDRSGPAEPEARDIEEILQIIMKNTGFSRETALKLHLEMWVFVHGIAAMSATSYLEWDGEAVSDMLTDIYEGLKWRFAQKEGQNDCNKNG